MIVTIEVPEYIMENILKLCDANKKSIEHNIILMLCETCDLPYVEPTKDNYLVNLLPK